MYAKIFFITITTISMFASCATLKKPSGQNFGIVRMNFYSITQDFSKQKSVLTYWRKINKDGTKGNRFAIGGANSFNRNMNTSNFKKPKDEIIKLEPGIYYLDSFELESKNKIIVSESGTYDQRNGWNNDNNTPIYLSFNIQEGENLILPKVAIQIQDNNSITFICDDTNHIFTFGQNIKHKNKF